MFNYIINPHTNQKLSIYSNNGKQLLKQYVRFFSGGMMNSTKNIVEVFNDYFEKKSSKNGYYIIGRDKIHIHFIKGKRPHLTYSNNYIHINFHWNKLLNKIEPRGFRGAITSIANYQKHKKSIDNEIKKWIQKNYNNRHNISDYDTRLALIFFFKKFNRANNISIIKKTNTVKKKSNTVKKKSNNTRIKETTNSERIQFINKKLKEYNINKTVRTNLATRNYQVILCNDRNKFSSIMESKPDWFVNI